ncbi:MAG TPA: sulfite exporter TauE/SafE family protein [Acetobacteraceae bacterium]|nr:sulfite exporter TauE/SafE family protein [Acetobacteraceae bacterium]
MHCVLALASGSLVGFSLGLIGGGGSILALPLLLYVVGVTDPHRAIGTSALAVAVSAFANLLPHARSGNVRWKPATIFAAAGALGAYAGSTAGKAFNGQRLLTLFAVLMLVIAGLMQRRREVASGHDGRLRPAVIARLAGVGLGAGVLSGFFGIGGGFLIVPGLILAADLSTLHAIGSSLLAVGAFGLTTAVNYAASGLVDWWIAALFIAGGITGGWLGAALAHRLSKGRDTLNRVFGLVVVAVALYMLARSTGWLASR